MRSSDSPHISSIPCQFHGLSIQGAEKALFLLSHRQSQETEPLGPQTKPEPGLRQPHTFISLYSRSGEPWVGGTSAGCWLGGGHSCWGWRMGGGGGAEGAPLGNLRELWCLLGRVTCRWSPEGKAPSAVSGKEGQATGGSHLSNKAQLSGTINAFPIRGTIQRSEVPRTHLTPATEPQSLPRGILTAFKNRGFVSTEETGNPGSY